MGSQEEPLRHLANAVMYANFPEIGSDKLRAMQVCADLATKVLYLDFSELYFLIDFSFY